MATPSRSLPAEALPAPATAGVGLAEGLRHVLLDFRHDWRMSVCQVLALMAVLTPLLVLFGLRFGIIDTLSGRLLENPRHREVVLLGNHRFEEGWFTQMAARPEVAFVIPRTRSIAATAHLRFKGNRRPGLDLDLVPTAAGDPVLGPDQPAPGPGEVVLSQSAAEKLGVVPSARLEASFKRVRQGRQERVTVDLEVKGILERWRYPRDAALVTLPLLAAVESYRDGIAVPSLGWTGAPPPAGPRLFASFRLFARSIADVPAMHAELAQTGLEIRTAAAEIEEIQTLDRNLGAVFWIVAGLGVSGYGLALAASMIGHVERKRRDYCILRLVGMRTFEIVLQPLGNAALTALLGGGLALLLYLPIQALLNRLFAASLMENERIALLLWQHGVVAVAGTLVVSLLAASLAGYRASTLEPSEGLRDV